jgi:hypothetical protein
MGRRCHFRHDRLGGRWSGLGLRQRGSAGGRGGNLVPGRRGSLGRCRADGLGGGAGLDHSRRLAADRSGVGPSRGDGGNIADGMEQHHGGQHTTAAGGLLTGRPVGDFPDHPGVIGFAENVDGAVALQGQWNLGGACHPTGGHMHHPRFLDASAAAGDLTKGTPHRVPPEGRQRRHGIDTSGPAGSLGKGHRGHRGIIKILEAQRASQKLRSGEAPHQHITTSAGNRGALPTGWRLNGGTIHSLALNRSGRRDPAGWACHRDHRLERALDSSPNGTEPGLRQRQLLWGGACPQEQTRLGGTLPGGLGW